jgi:hypothetical protein
MAIFAGAPSAPNTKKLRKSRVSTDSQVVELVGMNALISELLLAGLELASPLRDRGVDLIAYTDLASQTAKFSAVPLQVKVASHRSFTIDRKYERISNLVLVYAWNVIEPSSIEFYAMSYRQALTVADEFGYTESPSWKRGKYTNTAPKAELIARMQEFRMTRSTWATLVASEA